MQVKKMESFDQEFKQFIDILNPCMDNFLYILDIKKDTYYISPDAVERFDLESCYFDNAVAGHEEFVYPPDMEQLRADLQDIIDGEKHYHNLLYRWMDKQGNPVWINCRGQVIHDEDGSAHYLVGCINEIGRKKLADNVSGLLGESGFREELKKRGETGQKGFLMMLGVDNFKEINETQGMDYGDMILRKTAHQIGSVLKPDQKLYKIVADEFIVADFSGRSTATAVTLYEEIRKAIGRFIEENGYEVFYTISAGIVDLTEISDQSYVNLMKILEFTLNVAKDGGKNKVCIYDEGKYKKFVKRRQLLRTMRYSTSHNFVGFEVYYQPIVNIEKKRLSSAEALLRFNLGETGSVSPAEFIPLLEESGLIIPIGRWVLNQAVAACKRIQEVLPEFCVSVNLSYVQVLKSNVLGEILASVKQHGLSPNSLIIELTESGFLEADELFMNFCDGLKRYGIALALDDFGTGYSNFRYLYHLNPRALKIDRSFTLKALESDYEYNLLRHMAEMMHSIDSHICIEGIETIEDLTKIRGIQPDFIQGYYFGKPCPYKEFKKNYVDIPISFKEVE